MIIAALLAGIVVIGLGMCRAAAPKSVLERRFDDEAQWAAVTGRDDCDPHGIRRPDVLHRAFGDDDITSADVQRREIARLLRHPSAGRGEWS